MITAFESGKTMKKGKEYSKYGVYEKTSSYWEYLKFAGKVKLGGLGDIKKESVRFDHYSVAQEEAGIYLVPEVLAEESAKTKEPLSLSGQELLITLCNLNKDINFPRGKTAADPGKAVAKWCMTYTHPYDIDDIVLELEQMGEHIHYDKTTKQVAPVEKLPTNPSMEQLLAYREGTMAKVGFTEMVHGEERRIENVAKFKLDDFLKDLSDLCNATEMFFAIKEIEESGVDDIAMNLYKIGKYHDGLPFFEKYKEENIDFLRICQQYTELFPDLKMKLEYNAETEKFVLVPVVHSIFDIAWYTLSIVSGIIAGAPGSSAIYAIKECKNCHKLFAAIGRKEYCDDEDCQKARIRNNVRAFRKRKSSKK